FRAFPFVNLHAFRGFFLQISGATGLFFCILQINSDFFCKEPMPIQPLTFRFDQHSWSKVGGPKGLLCRILARYLARWCEFQLIVEYGHGPLVRTSGDVAM